MLAPVQRSRFNTAQLAPGQRTDGWRESIAALFDVSTAPHADTGNFSAIVDSFLINNQIILSRCDTQAQRFERNLPKVVRDNLDYYLVQTHIHGSQVMKRGSREMACGPGELMVIDLAEQHDAVTTDFANLTLVLPRHLLAPHLLQPDSQEGRVMKADNGLTMLAVNHLKSMYDTLGMFSETDALQIVEPTLLLVASALNGSVDSVESGSAGVASSQLAAAKVQIEKHLHHDLSVERLCAMLGYSRSNLYRMFEPLGGVRAYIQERRLRRSARVLLARSQGNQRICDIAYNWGFVSEAHYSRAFRQRYGMSPTQARHAAEQEQQHRAAGEAGNRDYEQWVAETLRL